MPLQGFKDGAECFFYSGSCRIETCFLANNYLHQKNQRFSKDIPQSARYHFKQSNVGQSVFFFQFQVWTWTSENMHEEVCNLPGSLSFAPSCLHLLYIYLATETLVESDVKDSPARSGSNFQHQKGPRVPWGVPRKGRNSCERSAWMTFLFSRHGRCEGIASGLFATGVVVFCWRNISWSMIRTICSPIWPELLPGTNSNWLTLTDELPVIVIEHFHWPKQ